MACREGQAGKGEGIMSDMIETSGREVTSDVMKAREVHAEIMASKKQVAIGIYELARGLKVMKDEKLYKELGFDEFPAYCERMAKVNVSQAYKYISTYEGLGESVLQSNGSLGIEKLFLMTQLPPEERAEAIEKPETIEGMSVKELREFVAKARQMGEQLSFLEAENQKLEDRLSEAEAGAKDEVDAKIEELMKKHDREIAKVKAEGEKAAAAKIGEMSEKIRAEAEAEAEKRIAARNLEEVKKEVDAARAEGEEAARIKLEASAKEGLAELEKQKQMYEELQKQLSGEVEEKDALKRKLRAASGGKAAFKVYLEQLYSAYKDAEDFTMGEKGYDLSEDERVECVKALRKLTSKLHLSAEVLETGGADAEDVAEYKERGEK